MNDGRDVQVPSDHGSRQGAVELQIVETMKRMAAQSGAPYAVVPLYPFFGRLVMAGEVDELVPLIYLDGGPKDGWVYDPMLIEKRESDGTGLTYAYEGDVGLLPDGRLVRIFRPAAPSQ